MFEPGKGSSNNQTERCAQLAKVRGVNAEISVDPSVLTNKSNELDTTHPEPQYSQNSFKELNLLLLLLGSAPPRMGDEPSLLK